MFDLLIIVFFAVIVLSPAAVAWVTQDDAPKPIPADRSRRGKPLRGERGTAAAPRVPLPAVARETGAVSPITAAVAAVPRRRVLVMTRTSGVVRAQARRW